MFKFKSGKGYTEHKQKGISFYRNFLTFLAKRSCIAGSKGPTIHIKCYILAIKGR